MKTSFRLFTMFALLPLALTLASPAQTLYENGPINGETDGWTINFGFVISDTPGDTLESAEVSITSELQGGTVYFDQVVNFTQSGCFLNNYAYDVCTETGTFNRPTLNNGTYWLNLQNATTTDGDPVYWDENSGVGCHSPGCPSEAGNGSIGTLPSEAFTILGTAGTGSTPEPGSLLLFASGLVASFGFVRRRFR